MYDNDNDNDNILINIDIIQYRDVILIKVVCDIMHVCWDTIIEATSMLKQHVTTLVDGALNYI